MPGKMGGSKRIKQEQQIDALMKERGWDRAECLRYLEMQEALARGAAPDINGLDR